MASTLRPLLIATQPVTKFPTFYRIQRYTSVSSQEYVTDVYPESSLGHSKESVKPLTCTIFISRGCQAMPNPETGQQSYAGCPQLLL